MSRKLLMQVAILFALKEEKVLLLEDYYYYYLIHLGGGHTGDVATSILIPVVVDMCKNRISPFTV